MRDVFISYAHEDGDRAQELAAALEGAGYSVWRDRLIVAGENWRQKIETAIREARSVVVIWSGHAAASDWVLEEATLAREQGKLVPARADGVEIPLSFRLIQTADLREWDAGVQQVIAGVAAILQKPPVDKTVEPKSKRFRRRIAAFTWLVLPTIAIAILAVASIYVRLPATVDIDVAVSSFRFRTAGDEPQVLLESVEAASLAVTGFQTVRLSPTAIWMADPARYDFRTDSYPDGAWTPVTPRGDLVLRPAGTDDATVLIKPQKGSERPLSLGTMSVNAAEGSLSTPEKGLLSIDLRGERNGTLTLPDLFELRANYCTLTGVGGVSTQPSLTLRAKLPAHSRFLEYSAGQVNLQLRLAGTLPKPLFTAHGLAVNKLEFTRLGRFGAQESTITGDGKIQMESSGSAVSPIPLHSADFLVLEDLRNFRVKGRLEQNQLRLTLTGVAGTLRSTSTANRLEDRRLSLLLTTAIGARKLLVGEHSPSKER